MITVGLKNILVPTDFSELSLVSLEYALPVAKSFGARIMLLHVLDKTASIELKKDAMNQLNHIAGQYFSTYNNVKQLIRVGVPFIEIVRHANNKGVDLVIISTHGRTGLSHVFMGSVAEKVARYSSVPVLTVKPKKIQKELMEQADIDEQLHISSNR